MRAADAPLDTATLARLLDRHPNGVRVQLQRLERSGLARRRPARGAVGRPRDLWLLTPRGVAAADLPEIGWTIARSLTRAIPATAPRLREVETAGAEMGRELAAQLGPAPASGGDDPFGAALEALGFAPRRADDGPTARYALMTCPYAATVRENPAVVCTMHRGIVRGVLACLDPEARLTAFEPKDPDAAGCVVGVERAAPRSPPPG